ncbi:MAG: UPF0182 family membrane protein [Candidatus Dormibacteria bacterium]
MSRRFGGGPGFEGPGSVSLEDLVRRLGDSAMPPHILRRIIVILLLGVLVVLIPPSITGYTDWLWFRALGFSDVFMVRFWAALLTAALSAGLFFLFAFANISTALRFSSARRLAVIGVRQRSLTSPIALIAFGIAILIAFGFALTGADAWQTVWLYTHRVGFGATDPAFNKDAGFYVFSLPFYQLAAGWAAAAVISAMLLSAFVYGLRGALSTRPSPAFTRHLSVLGALLAFVAAAGAQISLLSLPLQSHGVVHGAGYADLAARAPMQSVMTALMVLAGVGLLVNVWLGRRWPLAAAPALWVAGSVLLTGIYPSLVQRLVVQPSELSRESQYLKGEINGTRAAYGLSGITPTQFTTTSSVSTTDVGDNQPTLQSVRLWDYRPLLSTYSQIQSFRPYYNFRDIDIDRYTINGQYRQVMLSARELDTTNLPAQAQTWVNLHLKYTHGYGAVVNPVNESTAEGLPQLLVKDIPPTGTPAITQPGIYFGEGLDSYVLTGTTESELDYPGTPQDVYTHWSGTTGVAIDSFTRKLLFAIRFGDLNLLLSSQVQSGSQVLFHRDIQERISTIAPFLELDQDPYLVISGGRLYWIQDAFTWSDNYPYSRRAQLPDGTEVNYVRNSVKVVVDAYTGQVSFYTVDPTDPMLQTYSSVYPGMFQPMSAMPAGLRSHLRYPQDLFSLQADLYTVYHITDPQVLYNREDQWSLPNETLVQGSSQAIQPYYVISKAPGESTPEFQLILPMAPVNKQNMVALLVARNDAPHYGQLLDVRFSRDSLVYGPEQIESRIDQDPKISSQFGLWKQSGSTVIRGNLLVIPLGRSVLYVEPLYLQANSGNGGIPELQRVIVADGQHVAMESTLGDALADLLGQAPPTPVTPGPVTTPSSNLASLIAAANNHYNLAMQALRNGDFTTYGNEIAALGQVLQQMQAQP